MKLGYAVAIALMIGVLANSCEGQENQLCKAGLNVIFPGTCSYHPARGDVGAIVYLVDDSVTFPCRIDPTIDNPICDVAKLYTFTITVANSNWMQRFKDDSKMCRAEFFALVGDLNNDGTVSVSEVLQLITRWRDNTVPMSTVLQAITNWANTHNSSQQSRQAKVKEAGQRFKVS